MFRPLELYIGLRYTRAKRRNHFISFISLVSMLGVALGIIVMITVLSVMNGFQTEVRDRILGMASHATITGFNGQLKDWRTLEKRVAGQTEVAGDAPYVEGQAMLVNGQQVSGALLRGVLPAEEPDVSEVGEHMKYGELADLKAGEYGIVLGRELAAILGADPGGKVTVVTPEASVTPAGILPRLRRFTVTGIFEVGMQEYDSSAAFIHIADAATLFDLPDGAVSGLRLKLKDLFRAPAVNRELAQNLGGAYWVSDWTREHVNFFRAVQMEKTIMFIIMLLIVAVAAFNIVSTLVMLVTDKRADIAILRTLGITPRQVMAIFIIQGTIIGLVGTGLGVLGGTSLALNLESLVGWLEQLLDMQFLAPDVYYISELPSDVQFPDVLRISVAAFVLSVIATIYPAWRAARTQPAAALHYE
ncbi:MAG: lipoprotein-releasing ABC transporter permease subunit [Gammaproteobacteria bacterium]|nr:lipoprotein-releasing ABC transporter permease subunit [Gammaproteobacteria bacterium]